jgi:hypothetical protein
MKDLSTNARARDYAPKVFVEREGSRGKVARRAEFAHAMFDLLDDERIAAEPHGPPSKGKMKLVAVSPNKVKTTKVFRFSPASLTQPGVIARPPAATPRHTGVSLRLRASQQRPPKPSSIIVQVEGSGTAGGSASSDEKDKKFGVAKKLGKLPAESA